MREDVLLISRGSLNHEFMLPHLCRTLSYMIQFIFREVAFEKLPGRPAKKRVRVGSAGHIKTDPEHEMGNAIDRRAADCGDERFPEQNRQRSKKGDRWPSDEVAETDNHEASYDAS